MDLDHLLYLVSADRYQHSEWHKENNRKEIKKLLECDEDEKH